MVERIFSGVLAIVSLILLYLAQDYVAPIAYDPIGPRPYPTILLSLLALGTAFIALRPARLAEKIDLSLNPAIIKNLIVCTAALLFYGLLFEILGYIVATTLMAWIVGVLFEGGWVKSFIASAVMAILTYFLFNGPLEVSLPAGVLSFILG